VTTPPPPVHVLNRIPIVGPDFELESNLSCGSSFEDFDGPASSIWGDVLHHRPSFSSLLSQEDEGSRSSRTSLDGQSDAFNITADTGKIPNSSSRVLLAPSPSGSSHHRPAFRQASPSESPSTSSLPSSALPTQSPELPTRKVRFVTPLQLPPPPKEYKLDLKRIRDGGRRLSVVEETSPRDAMKLLSAMLS